MVGPNIKWHLFIELVNIKSKTHFSEQHMIEYPSGIVKYCLNHTLPRDYYSTEKLIKDLGLPIEKIDAFKNGCRFCENTRYKLIKEQNPCRKKSPYVVLRYLLLTPNL